MASCAAVVFNSENHNVEAPLHSDVMLVRQSFAARAAFTAVLSSFVCSEASMRAKQVC